MVTPTISTREHWRILECRRSTYLHKGLLSLLTVQVPQAHSPSPSTISHGSSFPKTKRKSGSSSVPL